MREHTSEAPAVEEFDIEPGFAAAMPEDPTGDTPGAAEDEITDEDIDNLFTSLQEEFGDAAPTRAEFDGWKKANSGKVRYVAFGPQEQYFLRPIRGNEWQALSARMSKMDDEVVRDRMFSEEVVKTCCLWPRLNPTLITALPAGTVPSLFMMVRDLSNFISPTSNNVLILDL